MSWTSPSITRDGEGGEVVRRPRSTDALGHALRAAFDGRMGLPDDMRASLLKLDRAPRPVH